MDRYEVMTGKMMPLTDGAHRKWGFTGKVVTRSYDTCIGRMGNEEHECAGSEERECARETSLSPAQGNRLRLLMLCGL